METVEEQPDALDAVEADGVEWLVDAPLALGGGVAGLLAFLLLIWFAFRAPKAPAPPEPTAPEVEAPAAEPVVEREGVVARLQRSLGRSRAALQQRFDELFGGGSVDEAVFDELEVALLSADVGVPTTERLLGELRKEARQGDAEPQALREKLRSEVHRLLDRDSQLVAPETRPWVILVVGVNGSGKTTTIGKLAAQLRGQGKKVMVAAGDTFRAAAIEQLQIWAERAGADIVAHQQGADPGAVVYDALQSAQAKDHDVVIIDTAGRLQTRKPLMEQLSKIRRVIAKLVPDGPHETLLVVDGTMGQNALSQATQFHDATPLTGVAVTKLDGTAKGGVVLSLSAELELPVKLIGIGEKIEDLEPFDPQAFADALA